MKVDEGVEVLSRITVAVGESEFVDGEIRVVVGIVPIEVGGREKSCCATGLPNKADTIINKNKTTFYSFIT